jgi:hypothetical protein
VFAGFVGLSRGLAYWQDAPRIQIDKVTHNPNLKNLPQVFDAEGTVTITPQTRGAGDFVVVVYTRSDDGGRIQLQMLGSAEDNSQEPRKESLAFGNTNAANWRVRIWLGSKDKFDPSYTVYAVVIKAFSHEDGKRLISLTHNEFTKFESIIPVLQKAGFQPLVWTDKKGVERYE